MEVKRLKEKRLSTDLPNVNAPISLGPEVCLSHGEYSAWNDARDQGPENREPWKGAKAKPYLAMHSRPGRYERYENLMRASRGSGQGALPMPEDEGFEQEVQHGRWEPHEREEEGEEKSERGLNDGSLRTLPKKPPQQEESGALSEEEEAEDGIQVIEDVERQAQDLEPEADEVSETEASDLVLMSAMGNSLIFNPFPLLVGFRAPCGCSQQKTALCWGIKLLPNRCWNMHFQLLHLTLYRKAKWLPTCEQVLPTRP